MVDVVRVLERAFPAVITARWEQNAALGRPLTGGQTTRLQCALNELSDVQSVLFVHVAMYEDLNVHLAQDLREEGAHVSGSDGFELFSQLKLCPTALRDEPSGVC